ncbi:MAG: electron transfer flavoprotein subunit alpha/FixB family protein [Bacteroidales bacterium]
MGTESSRNFPTNSVSHAKALAGMSGGDVIALSIGQVAAEELASLGAYGADKVWDAGEASQGLDNQVYTAVIASAMEKSGASVLVMAHNNVGKALAPRVSVRLKAGLVSGVVSLPDSVGPVTVSKKVFSGKAVGSLKVTTEKAILTVAQNSFEIAETGGSAAVEAFDAGVAAGSAKTQVKDVQKQEGKLLLTDAEVVISGGRGLKAAENWGPIEELASLLGGATACSRPVSDEGWRPHEEHTGQTGKIIAPNLYMAFGISGAIQHLAGVSSSKCIVAVNTDKDAPIFEAADYGIVGDALKVLPKLIEEIKAAKAQ